jgi:hypothetical protein
LVKVHRGSIHHFFAACVSSKIPHGLNGTNAQAAVKPALKAIATGRKKVARPTIETNAIDQISRALRWFEIVFTTGVIGIRPIKYLELSHSKFNSLRWS